jgi:hypothetical protein
MTTLDDLKLLAGTGTKEIKAAVGNLPPEQQIDLAKGVMGGLSASDRQEVARSLGMPVPSTKARDILWGLVISSACLTLVASALALLATIFIPNSQAQVGITIFTAILGFIAGIFVPSPVANKG